MPSPRSPHSAPRPQRPVLPRVCAGAAGDVFLFSSNFWTVGTDQIELGIQAKIMKLVYLLLFTILHILACSVGHAFGCRAGARRRGRNDQPCCPKTKPLKRPLNGKQPLYSDPDKPCSTCWSTHIPYRHPLAKMKVIMNQSRDGINRVGPL